MGLKHRHSYESVTASLKATEIHYIQSRYSGELDVALIFPNLYSLGMSNLGFLTVHRLLHQIPGIGVERFFPALEENTPLPTPYYSFETARPLGDFQILMFSFSYEGDFDKIPGIFAALGIPVESRKRNRHHPLLIAGGAAVASNYEALSLIFDILVPGEAETTLLPIMNCIKNHGADYQIIATIPGVYVPASGQQMKPCNTIYDINAQPAWSHIVATNNSFGGAHLVEVMRGCPRICSFCLARCIYAPARALKADKFIDFLDTITDCTRLGLVAPSLFDHPDVEKILEIMEKRKIHIRNSSIKWETLNPGIIDYLRKSGVTNLTLAPESGSEKLRKLIKKPLDESRFLQAIKYIFSCGFAHVKLYFVACLPEENQEDIDLTTDFIKKIIDVAPAPSAVSAAFSIFVPKNHTPWSSMNYQVSGVAKKKLKYYKESLSKISGAFKFSFASHQESQRQAYLAKAGPELALEYAREAEKCKENRLFGKNQFSALDF